jgi:hypothetical protein
MKTCIFLPPLRRPTGGVAVLLRIAGLLAEAGREVRLVLRDDRAAPVAEAWGAPVVPWSGLRLAPEDLWLVPEGWVNALTPGLNAGARCVVYCQNWAYLFSSLPPGVTWQQLPVSFMAVSQPVAWFIEQATGMVAPILRPGIDPELFAFRREKPGPPVRVAWMPRKNKAQAEQIRAVFESRQTLRGAGEAVRWVEIDAREPAEVAAMLGESHVFLATGFPEGFGLPPLEAMACGCLPVGFTGFGGWDYMRQALPEGAGAAWPWWPQRSAGEAPWGGNGFWVHDADVLAAALALEQAVDWWRRGDPRLEEVRENGRAVAAHYGLERQRRDLLELWDRAERGEIFMPGPRLDETS